MHENHHCAAWLGHGKHPWALHVETLLHARDVALMPSCAPLLQRGTLVVGVGVLWVLWSTILAHLMLLARFLLHMARLGACEHQDQLGWAYHCPGGAR